MMSVRSVFASSLLALFSMGANAAIDLRVTGTIVPAACSPFLTGGGVVDYGTIKAEELNQTSFSVLESKDIGFNIRCDAPTRVGLTAVDNRSSSKIPGILETTLGADYTSNYTYGLGTTTDNKNIGGYALRMKEGSFSALSIPLRTIMSLDDAATWIATINDGAMAQTGHVSSWSSLTGPLAPSPIEVLTGVLEIQAVINKTEDLDIKDNVVLDGLATLELRYL